MADWVLPLESSEEQRDYNVETTKFENTASEVRLITAGALIGFKCKSPALTPTQAAAYLAFFNTYHGSLTSFTYTSRMDNTDYTVRFVKGSFKMTYEGGAHVCTFELERVF
jgi:hypothetical protein